MGGRGGEDGGGRSGKGVWGSEMEWMCELKSFGEAEQYLEGHGKDLGLPQPQGGLPRRLL